MNWNPVNHAVLNTAIERLNANDIDGALAALNEELSRCNGRVGPGVHLLRAQAFLRRRSVAAFHALEAELLVNPTSAEARQQLDSILSQAIAPSNGANQREWRTGLSDKAVQSFENASQRHTYRGIPLIKNCFDLALYPMLLHDVRPRTIIEVGTLYGGSAVWLSDLTRSFGMETQIYSIDVAPMSLMDAERVTYLQGSGRELGATLSPQFIAGLARPLLVIEDADHEYPTTEAVLEFFHPILQAGEYIVVEDVMSAAGARRALTEFLQQRGHDYVVDSKYCDFFGYNVTWCMNGFLRRK